ncbi:hypothetical protein LN042_21545 [Kitasatospora sp. RB6PN24]|uniref:ABC transporter permease n=1 Tax=Kitasatospora humi TaxID=2893891 RepID=UPI001E2B4AEF|nr:FtsX-like permease family protein [Kitasatospora humi]MCC9309626.1 hypothetical protein [Kitasatospora humi]
MISLGIRLALAGGREALARLVVIACAVAAGVGLLLGMLAAINGVHSQDNRYSWLNSAHSTDTPRSGVDPLWWRLSGDAYQGERIGRVDVAATGTNSPVPPGIPRLPAPGEYYASPALARLLADLPADQLADRYPGHLVGTIGSTALPGPDSLVIVVGRTPAEVKAADGSHEITSITTTPSTDCDDCPVGPKGSSVILILSVTAGALVFPVLILVGMATRLSAARREYRFAAMRLVGATPRQVSVIATAEAALAAAAGVAIGFAVFPPIRLALVRMDFTGTPFFLSDLSLNLWDVLLVVLGVPVAAAVAAGIALARVRVSPLGVARRVTPPPPRAWRLLPMLLGVAELAFFIGRRPNTSAGQSMAFTPGMVLILGGLVYAGPWLTMVGARLMVGRSNDPAVLIAGRRLADDPKAGFRSVGGLVLALCVTTGSVAIITAITAERGLPEIYTAGAGAAVDHTVLGSYLTGWGDDGRPTGAEKPLPASVTTQLRAIPGVAGVTVIHADPLGTPDPTEHQGPVGAARQGGLASCEQLAGTPLFHTCAAGAQTATTAADFDGFGVDIGSNWPRQWPTSSVPAAQLDGLPVLDVVVGTTGSAATVERVRTLLEGTYPDRAMAPWTLSEYRTQAQGQLSSFQRLANTVTLASLVVAGCSLAVGVAGGLSERRRPFSLLRLTGVQLGVLRRTVLLESAMPLLVVSGVAIGMGFLAAELFLKAQLGYSVRSPGAMYCVMVVGGLAASLGVITSTLPLLRRITGPEAARND